jgi:hypothetical protein
VSNIMLTFHGGSSSTSINNVGVFTIANGTTQPADPFYALQPAQDADFGALPALRELRGLVPHHSDGTLLVANAYKEFSQILQFTTMPESAGVEFGGLYAANQVNHPFDVVFGFNDYLYVSNQDAARGKSPVVTYYTGANTDGAIFTTSVTFQSLRGLAFDGKYLYVADAGADKKPGSFYVFASNGDLVKSFALEQPVHLLYDETHYIYIGDEAKNCVYLYDTISQDAPTPLIDGKTGLDHTAGLALLPVSSASATLLVASRKGSSVMAYPITLGTPPKWDGTYKPALSGLTDLPEFILVS